LKFKDIKLVTKETMVKNTKGGSGHKSQARKFVAAKSFSKTRLSEDESEIYAFVTKKSGGENIMVMCQDEKERRCIIRGKFRSSRGKRDNFIAKGTWVLVGVRDWSSNNEICDLLEVYNENDKNKLKTIQGINWQRFISHDAECSNTTTEDDSVVFTTNTSEEEEYAKLVSESKSQISLNPIEESTEDEIDIDDI